MGVDVGVEDGSRIEVTFEEVNNENINVELIDNPVTIELDTPGNVQVSFNEQYSDVNVILDHNKQINRNLNKQHTAETIQESTSKRFTSDLEISNLEPKKGVDEFYLSGDEKSKLDRLLVDLTVPSDTPSLTFDRDKNGVLLSDLGLKSISIIFTGNSTISTLASSYLQVNSVALNYKTNGGIFNAVIYRTAAEFSCRIDLFVNKYLSFYSTSTASSTTLDDNTAVFNGFYGIARGITAINTIYLENRSGLFKAGSIIKIYRND